MKIDILDIKKPKLTISKEEVRLKFPLNYSEPEKDRILEFAMYVVGKVGPVEQTLRGNFLFFTDRVGIQLRTTGHVATHRFSSAEIP